MQKKHSIWIILFGCLLAIVTGAAAPISFSFATPILGVMGPLLYAWAGIAPAVLFTLMGLLVSTAIGGGTLAAVYLSIIVLPAAVTLTCIRKKREHKQCIYISVLAQAFGIVLALCIAWLRLRVNIVDWWIGTFLSVLKSMPDAFYAQFDKSLLLLMQLGAFGPAAGTIELTNGVLSAADRLILLDEYGRMATFAYKTQLAGMLLTSSLLAGVLSATIPVWIWARRGDDRGIRRLPVSEWRISSNAAIGLPLCALISYILLRTGYPGGEAVWYAVWGLFTMVLQLQMCGAVSRSSKKTGSSVFVRGLLILMFLTTLTGIGTILGAISLYFGSQGLISTWLRNRRSNNPDQ